MKLAELQKLAEASFVSLGKHLRTDQKVFTEPGKADRHSQIHHVLVGVGVIKVTRYLDKPTDAKTFEPFQPVLVTLEPERLPREKGKSQGYSLKLACEPAGA